MKKNAKFTTPTACPTACSRPTPIPLIRLVLLLPALLLTACFGDDGQPQDASAPAITGTPPATATVGRTWSFQPVIQFPENDPVTVTTQNRPGWMSLDASTGRLQGTPGEGDVRTWSNILVQASDGQATVSLPSFSVVVSAQGAATGTATLSWNPPTQRTDGTPIGALAGYQVLYGQASRAYDTVAVITNPGITRHMVEGLGPGTWYFAVQAVTVDGLKSAPSQEVSKSF